MGRRLDVPSNATEIAPDTYQISAFDPDFGIQFNEFLIKGAKLIRLENSGQGFLSAEQDKLNAELMNFIS